ncbi:MAG: IS630 family transposase, partial [Bacteroidetes bacterium]|nr:IS630 family transposase [Bacteroidota bacterium]
MEKQDFRKLSSQERFVMRKRAIILIKDGTKQKEVAKIFGVRISTVNAWVKNFKSDSINGLKDEKRGVKPEGKKLLSSEQEKAIQKMIIDKMPDQLKLSFSLWTRKAVKELIEREFGVVLAVTTTGDYLRSWGFTPQKPKKKAYEQNPQAVERWLKDEYPKITKKAKSENAEIHWGDETGVKNSSQHGRSYAPKGKTPVRRMMGKRLSTNMISSITNQGKVEFMIYSGTMNADRFLKFLRQLVKNKERKIYLIIDNLKVHHSKIVKTWVYKNQRTIELFFLSSYSPEKNPDEYLNCDLK